MTNELQQASHIPHGLESGDAEDIIMPKLMPLQFMSKAVTRDGMKAGKILFTAGNEQLDTVKIVPITFKKHFWLTKKDGDETKIVHRSDDSNDPRLVEDKGNGVRIQKVFDFVVAKDGNFEIPVLVRFTKSSYWAGREIFSNASLEQVPLSHYTYDLTLEKDGNDKGQWFVFKLKNKAVTIEADLKLAETLYSKVSGFAKKAVVHASPAAEEEVPF